MEKHQVLLQSLRRMESVEVTTDVSLDSQPGEQDVVQHESTQETLEPETRTPTLDLIEFRIQQLHNRRFLLLQLQNFQKKDHMDGTTEETSRGDGDKLCELEVIQKELEVLETKMKEMQEPKTSTDLINTCQGETSQRFTVPVQPRGGIYTLPPYQQTQSYPDSGLEVETTASTERPMGPVIPFDSLGRTAEVTECPSCHEVIFTETRKKAGESVWIVSCLFAAMGCVAGCCLIPFCIDRLQDVQHKCPQCQAVIHTDQPF